jgi:hypothetical protein
MREGSLFVDVSSGQGAQLCCKLQRNVNQGISEKFKSMLFFLIKVSVLRICLRHEVILNF